MAANEQEDRTIDLESLKVLAHPLRVRIIDVLSQYGPYTASGLAQRLGESSGATSYHLRQLARHDFVRELEGRGTARERWWQRTPRGINLDARELNDTIAGRTAIDLVMREWQRNRENALMEFLTRGVDELPDAWIDPAVSSTADLRLTVEQLTALTRDVMKIVNEFADRYRGQRNDPVPGSRPVQIQFNAFPLIDGEETPS
jgi:DNA-binding transcriptional ArsR family regulator